MNAVKPMRFTRLDALFAEANRLPLLAGVDFADGEEHARSTGHAKADQGADSMDCYPEGETLWEEVIEDLVVVEDEEGVGDDEKT